VEIGEIFARKDNLCSPHYDVSDMLELPLHTGAEHPDLTLVVLSSLLTFLAGLGAGTYGDRVRAFVRTLTTDSTE